MVPNRSATNTPWLIWTMGAGRAGRTVARFRAAVHRPIRTRALVREALKMSFRSEMPTYRHQPRYWPNIPNTTSLTARNRSRRGGYCSNSHSRANTIRFATRKDIRRDRAKAAMWARRIRGRLRVRIHALAGRPDVLASTLRGVVGVGVSDSGISLRGPRGPFDSTILGPFSTVNCGSAQERKAARTSGRVRVTRAQSGDERRGPGRNCDGGQVGRTAPLQPGAARGYHRPCVAVKRCR